MIVARMVWHVKPGKVEQVAEMLSQFLHDPDHPMKRVYVPKISPLHRVVFEEEYESVAEWREVGMNGVPQSLPLSSCRNGMNRWKAAALSRFGN